MVFGLTFLSFLGCLNVYWSVFKKSFMICVVCVVCVVCVIRNICFWSNLLRTFIFPKAQWGKWKQWTFFFFSFYLNSSLPKARLLKIDVR